MSYRFHQQSPSHRSFSLESAMTRPVKTEIARSRKSKLLFPSIIVCILVVLCMYKCDAHDTSLRVGKQLSISPKPTSSQHRELQSSTDQSFSIRINAGGEDDYIDSTGRLWIPDTWVKKGTIRSSAQCTSDIDNTTDDILYCSNRFFTNGTDEGPFEYNIPIPWASTYEVRLHFAEVTYRAVGRRIFDIFIEGQIFVQKLDVFERAGVSRAYSISIQLPVTDEMVQIRLVPVIDDPFVSAIEVVEIYNATESTQVPSSPTTDVIRINTGGTQYIDSSGRIWVSDVYFQDKGEVSAKSCNTTFRNITDSLLYCTERYFRDTDSPPYVYSIPVNSTANYEIVLHFSENHFFETGKRLFDVLVEGVTVLQSFDVVAASGGPLTPYKFSTIKNVTDGFVSIEFIPKVNFPTISAIEVILIDITSPPVAPSSNVTTLSPIQNISSFPTTSPSTAPSASTSAAPSLSVDQQSSPPSDFRSDYPSISPTFVKSSFPTILSSYIITRQPTTNPSDVPSSPTTPNIITYEFDLVTKSVNRVRMILGRSTEALEESQAFDSNCTSIWQVSIQDRIEAEVMSEIPQYETVDIDLYNVTRSSNFSALSLTFDVEVRIRSPLQDFFDAQRLVTGPFNTQNKRNEYVDFLASSSCPEFYSISSMELTILSKTEEKDTSTDVNGKSNEPDDGNMLFLYAAISAGVVLGAVVVSTIALGYYRAKRRRRSVEINNESTMHTTAMQFFNSRDASPSEIDDMNDGVDVSTLGDSIISKHPNVKSNDDDASTVGSTTEYDFKEAFLDLNSISESMMSDSMPPNPHGQTYSQNDNLLFANDIVSVASDDEDYGNSLLYL